VSDLLETYQLTLPFDHRWYLRPAENFGGSDVSIPAKFSQFSFNIRDLSSQVPPASLTLLHKCNLLKLVKTSVTNFQVAEVQSSVTLAIPLIFKAHTDDAVRVLALKLGTVLPRHEEVIKRAAEVAKLPCRGPTSRSPVWTCSASNRTARARNFTSLYSTRPIQSSTFASSNL
jgi:hypothetical protein